MHHPTARIAHTTAFVTPVVEHWLEREIASKLVMTYFDLFPGDAHPFGYQLFLGAVRVAHPIVDPV